MVYCIVLKYTLFIMLYQTIFPYVVLCFFLHAALEHPRRTSPARLHILRVRIRTDM